jgi:polysaccharide biosynthesis/export protein
MDCLSNCLKPTIILMLIGGAQFVSAQNSSSSRLAAQKYSEPISYANTRTSVSGESSLDSYKPNSSEPLIAAGDEVEVAVYGAPDLGLHGRVGVDGSISMPLIGDVGIAGLSSNEAERAIAERLRRENVVNHPQVSVYVKEYASGGISVAGEVAKPGVYSALGPHRLFDILQDAGGRTEKATDSVVISHRDSKRPNTIDLPRDPEQLSRLNIDLLPGDTVVVPKAGIVYVLGGVNKPGGYVLGSEAGVTLLRVIAAAGGPTQTAALSRTKMLRRTPNGLQEVPVPLKKLLHAKVADIAVQADDIIYLPSSRMKEILNAGALISTAGTAAIYRIP